MILMERKLDTITKDTPYVGMSHGITGHLDDAVQSYLNGIQRYPLIDRDQQDEIFNNVRNNYLSIYETLVGDLSFLEKTKLFLDELYEKGFKAKYSLRNSHSNNAGEIKEEIGILRKKFNLIYNKLDDLRTDEEPDVKGLHKELSELLVYNLGNPVLDQLFLDSKSNCEDLTSYFSSIRRSRSEIVTANLRFVIYVAKTYQNRGVEFIDLISAGNKGLIRASEKFDFDRDITFNTYAIHWIRQAIMTEITEQGSTIRLPQHTSEILTKYHKTFKNLSDELGRSPTIYEIVGEMKTDVDSLMDVLNVRDMLSLDSQITNGSDSNFYNLLKDENVHNPASDVFRSRMEKLLIHLPERQEKIMRCRVGFEDGIPWTLEEIGDLLGITRERVRQLEAKALKTLSKISREEYLSPFVKDRRIKGREKYEGVGSGPVEKLDDPFQYTSTEPAKARIRTKLEEIVGFSDAELIERAVNALPYNQNMILRWRYCLDGNKKKKSSEISDILGINLSSISKNRYIPLNLLKDLRDKNLLLGLLNGNDESLLAVLELPYSVKLYGYAFRAIGSEKISNITEKLSEDEKKIFDLILGITTNEPKYLKDITGEFSLGTIAIKRKLDRALEKIRSYLRGDEIKDEPTPHKPSNKLKKKTLLVN